MTLVSKSKALEEKWNSYSHGFGLLLGFVGMIILLPNPSKQTFYPLLLYSLSVIILFSASTAYHYVSDSTLKSRLRILDHISIYYLIAGTYTPVCLFVLNGSKGIMLLWAVWGLAFFGTVLKLFFTGRFKVFSLLLYVLMGWLVVVDLPFLIESMSAVGLRLLALGGAFYTLGILFYALQKIPYNHLIWHFFVLGGALSHWLMIYEIVMNRLT